MVVQLLRKTGSEMANNDTDVMYVVNISLAANVWKQIYCGKNM